ncbi:carboxylesterase family protein [Orbus wheelerorum]|uniref:carboxylesterase/lipase family protein n=1 Tax=Orbus wheelerorum TaxID=3074111 RepID=UPI00370D56FC
MKNMIKKVLILALISLSPFIAFNTVSKIKDTILIDSGIVQGKDNGDLISWLGIPYATAPIGNLRWAPPTLPAKWSGIYNAKQFGNFCPQNDDLGVFGAAGGAEDCLNLNVYISKKAMTEDQKRPVFVWIHGGSLWVGANRDYDASKLALQGGVIVVTINYRLGILGYFASPELKKEYNHFANYGLMDQQFALDWVQRNIAAFGGDPTNVTISGESSGGNSVMSHIISPASAGKFQHAIVMSGASVILKHPTFGAPKPLDYAYEMAEKFAHIMGCDVDNQLSCLRSLPLDKILANQRPYIHNQIIIDGSVIPAHPSDLLRNGHFNHVTFVNGTTLDEGTFFAGFPENQSGQVMDQDLYKTMMQGFFGDYTDAVIKEYPIAQYVTRSNAFAAAATDMEFACTARMINRLVADKMPTYAYEFSDRTAPSYLKPTSFALGAAHTYELSYIFPGFHGGNGIKTKLNAFQEKLSNQMVQFWTKTDKLTDGHFNWSAYDKQKDNYMRLILPQAVMQENYFNQVHHCDFWDASGAY